MRTKSPSFCRSTLVLAVMLVASVGTLGGCAFDPSEVPADDPSVGAVEMALELAPGISIATVSWEITGNGFQRAGTIDVGNSSRVSAVLGGIPAGLGYIVTLRAEGTDGITCSGASSFDVVGGTVSQVDVHMLCRRPRRTGSVVVDGTLNVCPLIDDVSISPASAAVGQSVALSADASDLDFAPAALTFAWTTTLGEILQGNQRNAGLTCTAVGTAIVTLTVSDGDCEDAIVANVSCTEAIGSGTPQIVINEVESSGGTPGDWVELYNAGTAPANLSGWIFRDNDDTHTYVIPVGTVVQPGAYFVLEEAAFGFGLGGNEQARLFDPNGTLREIYAWTSHAPVTYGRCPNGVGEFTANPVSTKGSENACGTTGADAGVDGGTDSGTDGGVDGGMDGGVAASAWPGSGTVSPVDVANTFGANLSGLTYQPASGGEPAVIWAALNSPSKVYRLVQSGSNWIPDPSGGWSSGKTLRYPGGTGAPDTEGVTKAEWTSSLVYVATERNNEASSVSRQSVLLFDTAVDTAELVALREWSLHGDLPVVGANLGLEAITWIPDAFLVGNGFVDESTGTAYDPAGYPAHAGGVFFVGVEGTGRIYGYVLDHVLGSFTRVATITNPQASVMDLEFDRDLGILWSWCDNTCNNRAAVLAIETTVGSPNRGRFVVRAFFDRPTGLPNVNNEGFAIAPEAECVGGEKAVFWSDDDQTGGNALRQGSVLCGPLF